MASKEIVLLLCLVQLFQFGQMSTMPIDDNAEEVRIRHKRATVLAAFEVASTLIGLADTGYGIYQDQEDARQLQQLQSDIGAIRRATEELKLLLSDAKAQQAWQHAVDLFGGDIQTLSFLLYTLNEAIWDDDGSLISAQHAFDWADHVLDKYDIAKILYNLHEMMMGTNFLFGATPLYTLYVKTLDRDADNFDMKIQEFVNFTVDIQVAGYVAWVLALAVEDRSVEDAARVLILAQERILTDQKELLEYLLVNPSEQEDEDDVCGNGAGSMENMTFCWIFTFFLALASSA